MIVSLEEIEAMQARRAEINAVPLAEITWTRNGVPLPVSKERIEDWKFVGMSNIAFPEFFGFEEAKST